MQRRPHPIGTFFTFFLRRLLYRRCLEAIMTGAKRIGKIVNRAILRNTIGLMRVILSAQQNRPVGTNTAGACFHNRITAQVITRVASTERISELARTAGGKTVVFKCQSARAIHTLGRPPRNRISLVGVTGHAPPVRSTECSRLARRHTRFISHRPIRTQRTRFGRSPENSRRRITRQARAGLVRNCSVRASAQDTRFPVLLSIRTGLRTRVRLLRVKDICRLA